MEIILKVISLIAGIYFTIAIGLFIGLLIGKHIVKITNYRTGEEKEIKGIKKIGIYLFMSLLWIISINIKKGGE